MRRTSIAALLALALPLGFAAGAAAAGPAWPSLERQLAKDKVQPGSALEQLIRANQDFRLLRAEEASDHIPVPAWLRVHWRRHHPEMVYDPADPTGGYPHVLKEVHEWMVSHQDLRAPEVDEAEASNASLAAITVGGDKRISGPQTSPRSESDIRINFWNPSRIIGASNNISASGRQAQFYSSDGGATWGQSLLPLATGDAFHSDPTVDWTSDGRAWSTTIGINATATKLKLRAYVSNDGGATWTLDNTFSGKQNSADKQQHWIDHSATSPFKDNIYTCWHNGLPQFANRRTAAGWGSPIQVSGAESSGTAIGCDVKTDSAGNAFVFWPTTGNRRIVVAKSTNGGGSWGAPQVIHTMFDGYDIGVPSFNNRRALIYVSAGTSGSNVHVTWTDLTGAAGCTSSANEPGSNVGSSCKTRIWYTRSTNGGSTWEAPRMINNQASLNDQFNQWLAVDDTSGKVGVMYYDTVADPGRKKTHVYFQSSSDQGVTWGAPVQVTTAQTDETVAGADSGNQYGDYNGLSGFLTKFFPSWTDRRGGAKEEIWTVEITDP